MKKSLWHRTGLGGAAGALAVAALLAWAGQSSAADVAAGKAIFKKRCAVCHGKTGAADGPMSKILKPPPPSFADAGHMAKRSDEELLKIIKEGKKPMPAYSGKLTEEQIQNVLAYIRSLAAK